MKAYKLILIQDKKGRQKTDPSSTKRKGSIYQYIRAIEGSSANLIYMYDNTHERKDGATITSPVERVIKEGVLTTIVTQNTVYTFEEAVCRADDSQYLKLLMFKAFVGDLSDFNGIIDQLLDQHTKQSNFVSNMYNSLIKKIEPTNGDVMIIECDNTSCTGLVANKLRDYYNKNILLVHKESDEYIGSCRAYCDLLNPLNKSGLMTICAGHENVFGVGWKVKDTKKLKSYLNTLDLTPEPQNVIMSYSGEIIPQSLFDLSERYSDMWGTNVPKPTVYFHIPFNDINIKLIGGGHTLKFIYGDMDFIKFRISNKDKEINGKYINIIGSLQMNYYMGRAKRQVVIDKWESE